MSHRLVRAHKRLIIKIQQKTGLSDYQILWLAFAKGIIVGIVLTIVLLWKLTRILFDLQPYRSNFFSKHFTQMTPDNSASNSNNSEMNRALTYSEMMNEGRQNMKAENRSQGDQLHHRVEELERKVEHLQNVIQRQLRLGRMLNSQQKPSRDNLD